MLPEYTIDLLRQINPEIPRHVGYTSWIYEPAPYLRGTWFNGVRVLHKPTGLEGVIVGTRLEPASTILVQFLVDGHEYAPGRCDFAPEWDLEPTGRAEPAPAATTRLDQLSLLDEVTP